MIFMPARSTQLMGRGFHGLEKKKLSFEGPGSPGLISVEPIVVGLASDDRLSNAAAGEVDVAPGGRAGNRAGDRAAG
jgi:hypothetical protein